MKRNNTLYCTAALLLVILAAACTRDDDFAGPPATDAPATATSLTITVTDGAYAPAESPDGSTPATRAVERGYGTEFTAGDRIGLYAVEIYKGNRRNLRYENLCLTYDGTGWTPPPGTPLTHSTPEGGEIVYLAYYPYQDDMTRKFSIDAPDRDLNSTTEARYFFLKLADDWKPAADQSTYAAYTASDLMVAKGVVSKRTDGTDGSLLSFTMEHQMALAVFRAPATKCTYTETITRAGTTEKSYHLYSGLEVERAWKENSYTARFLINPVYGSPIGKTGVYYTKAFEQRRLSISIPPKVCPPGAYYTYTIDGGQETESDRPLRQGDFYMRDGTVLPQDAFNGGNLPAAVQADCLGVVFWVGENDGNHWTQTSNLYGDKLLMRDHPGCVRGMAVALRDASMGAAWATGEGANEYLYPWAKGFAGFTPEEQADWSIMEKSDPRYGYWYFHLMKLYSAYHKGTAFPARDAIAGYAAAHPAPGTSSGWFFPGRRELAMMCYGLTDNYESMPVAQRDALNRQFAKAGGEAFAKARYWGSYDAEAKAWSLDFNGKTYYSNEPKSSPYHVRAVLAF